MYNRTNCSLRVVTKDGSVVCVQDFIKDSYDKIIIDGEYNCRKCFVNAPLGKKTAREYRVQRPD